MNKMGLTEIKEVELNILKNVATICDENNIRYYLAGGTLLGAVRHKGFIPWDDDIDITMPRKDYNKFLAIAEKMLDSRFQILSRHNTSNYIYPFAKIVDRQTILIEDDDFTNEIGVYIDVFPIDGLPADLKKSNMHFKLLKILKRVRSLVIHKLKKERRNKLTYLISVVLSRIISPSLILKIIEKVATKYSFEESEYVAVTVAGYDEKERMRKEGFQSFFEVQFEDSYFKAPVGYKEYLTNLYGDYMKLPPQEKRTSHHRYQAYWR
jgi:lipopolysaccharide cholinephosphotransferase